MTFFLCKLWPYLAGGLIGWLLAGWFARRLKHVAPVEKIVEKHIDKVVDNPEHLALIGKLQRENGQLEKLRFKINRNLESKGSSIDQTEHLALAGKLEKETSQVSLLTSKLAELESANKEIPALKTRIKSFDNQQSQAASGKTVEVEKLVDNPAHLKRITELEGEISDLQRGPAIDFKAAKAAGLSIKMDTDFTVIEGIGPKINDLIHAGGIRTFAELANSDPSRIQKILDDAGSRYTIANPGTWPDQANLVVNNRWPALKALQDVLDGGVYPDGSAKSKGASSTKSSNAKSASTAKKKPAKKTPPKLDIEAAKTAGFKIKQNNGQDDFTLIEGIGPKINELIHDDGIHTFTELADTHVDVIQKILDNAGPRYKLAKPGTWPAQSDMAASNKWDSLKAWQDELDGGE
ncbi:MAG: helix-hairpin-helix domain-containing protein [Cocleimonas sp.]|nr:helix-hairpin-helix domain-containing protein [Cocleimonas sp.]